MLPFAENWQRPESRDKNQETFISKQGESGSSKLNPCLQCSLPEMRCGPMASPNLHDSNTASSGLLRARTMSSGLNHSFFAKAMLLTSFQPAVIHSLIVLFERIIKVQAVLNSSG
jgi:hypothetical protein